jgi:hypothetical protein
MNRREAIRLLKGGRDGILEWNQRRGRGEEIPDLRGAQLSGADLSGADLRGARLGLADLSGAHLGLADLSGAHLIGADLRRAVLLEADLNSAICATTIFGDVDLSEVKGLESITHEWPSTVGVDTLVKSRGRIPEAFLRGCGVPEAWIEYLPSLIGALEPIQFYSCFISYSTKDEDFAKRLHSRMVQEKLRVWFAPEDIRGGKKIHEQIDEAIRVYDKLLLVLSPHSIGSKWVRNEIRRARKAEVQEGQRKLFPIRLMGYEELEGWESFYADLAEDVAEEIRKYFIPDFSDWKDHDSFEAAFARLIRDLKATTSTGEGSGRAGPTKRT